MKLLRNVRILLSPTAVEILILAKKLTIDSPQKNLGELLERVSEQTQIEVKQMDNLLVVRSVQKSKCETCAMGLIHGRIIDEQANEVLPGATILQKGTNNGTTSDVNGEFLLRVPSGEVEIEVRYIGFQEYTESVNVPENGSSMWNLK